MKVIVFMFVIGIILEAAMLIRSIGNDDDSIEYKAYMCVTSKRCDGNCESCEWYIGHDESSDGRESTKGE